MATLRVSLSLRLVPVYVEAHDPLHTLTLFPDRVWRLPPQRYAKRIKTDHCTNGVPGPQKPFPF